MKKPRTKQQVRLQIGKQKARLYLVPKAQADVLLRQLQNFEVNESTSVPWQKPIEDLIQSHTPPGAALKGARVKENTTQTSIAAKLGIPPSNISEMESGKRPIGKAMAKRLSKILRLDYRVFL